MLTSPSTSSLEAISTCFLVPHDQVAFPLRLNNLQKPFKYLKSHFLTPLTVHFSPSACAFACLCGRPLPACIFPAFHSKDNINLYSTCTLIVSGVFSLTSTGAGLFKILNRECPCSYFARHLFCRCTNTCFVSSAFILTWRHLFCMGVIVLFPPRLRQEKAFFSKHWQTLAGYHQPCTVKDWELISFSACTIPAATC